MLPDAVVHIEQTDGWYQRCGWYWIGHSCSV